MDLVHLLKYPPTPFPYGIGTTKIEKSKGFKYLVKETDTARKPPQDNIVLVVEDENARFYCMKDVPNNFRQICEKPFNMMPCYADVIFSTDMYKEDSVKAMERKCRGCTET